MRYRYYVMKMIFVLGAFSVIQISFSQEFFLTQGDCTPLRLDLHSICYLLINSNDEVDTTLSGKRYQPSSHDSMNIWEYSCPNNPYLSHTILKKPDFVSILIHDEHFGKTTSNNLLKEMKSKSVSSSEFNGNMYRFFLPPHVLDITTISEGNMSSIFISKIY